MKETTRIALYLLGSFAVPSAMLTALAVPESFIVGCGIFATTYIICASLFLSIILLIECATTEV